MSILKEGPNLIKLSRDKHHSRYILNSIIENKGNNTWFRVYYNPNNIKGHLDYAVTEDDMFYHIEHDTNIKHTLSDMVTHVHDGYFMVVFI